MLTKTLISIGLGIAVAVSPFRDSAVVNIIIAITGG